VSCYWAVSLTLHVHGIIQPVITRLFFIYYNATLLKQSDTVRILFTSQAQDGHFNPLVPLARGLAEAGHEVAFACAPSYCTKVQALGFHCFSAGMDAAVSEWPRLFPQLNALEAQERTAWVRRHVFAGATARQMVPALLELAGTWSPDVFVREKSEFGACVAAEVLGLPHAVVQVGAFDAYSPKELLGEELSALRATYSLPADPELEMLHRYLHLSFVPPSFQNPDVPMPTTTHHLRPVFFDTSGDEHLPAWLVNLPKRPTVYVTLGTIANNKTHIFSTIIEALRDEPLNLIVTVGRDQDPAQFGQQPPNVHIERYIPQTLIFPYCDLAIAHGGFSTVLTALGFGLPLVVIPLLADQPVNADRCEALGVGRAIAPGDLTPESVRDTVNEVLEVASYRHNARRVQQEMRALPGLERAVELLERLAADRIPLTAQSPPSAH
jgi:UDP:flavonoid glycosyltransferase YjiC (YdhE family)